MTMPLLNIRNNVCFIREQNPVKDLLLFTINYYFFEVGVSPPPFSFFLILVLGKKECALCGIQESTCHRNVILPSGK